MAARREPADVPLAGDPDSRTNPSARCFRSAALEAAFGYTREELLVVLRPMWREGREPVGSMGDDTPAAALSDVPRPLFHYFKQRFAEVTNPPIDSLREELVMSLTQVLGGRGCLLTEDPEAARLLELRSPILSNDDLSALRALGETPARSRRGAAVGQSRTASGTRLPARRLQDGQRRLYLAGERGRQRATACGRAGFAARRSPRSCRARRC